MPLSAPGPQPGHHQGAEVDASPGTSPTGNHGAWRPPIDDEDVFDDDGQTSAEAAPATVASTAEPAPSSSPAPTSVVPAPAPAPSEASPALDGGARSPSRRALFAAIGATVVVLLVAIAVVIGPGSPSVVAAQPTVMSHVPPPARGQPTIASPPPPEAPTPPTSPTTTMPPPTAPPPTAPPKASPPPTIPSPSEPKPAVAPEKPSERPQRPVTKNEPTKGGFVRVRTKDG